MALIGAAQWSIEIMAHVTIKEENVGPCAEYKKGSWSSIDEYIMHGTLLN